MRHPLTRDNRESRATLSLWIQVFSLCPWMQAKQTCTLAMCSWYNSPKICQMTPFASFGGFLPAEEWEALGVGKIERSLPSFSCINYQYWSITTLVENQQNFRLSICITVVEKYIKATMSVCHKVTWTMLPMQCVWGANVVRCSLTYQLFISCFKHYLVTASKMWGFLTILHFK